MTNHPQTLATFLKTDLYRLETALEEPSWNAEIATRLRDHLHRLNQLLLLITPAAPPIAPPDTMEAALNSLDTLTTTLLATISTLSEAQLNTPVLDIHERNLTLLAHLYDYARLSAMLVEWSRHLPPAATVEDWFQSVEE